MQPKKTSRFLPEGYEEVKCPILEKYDQEERGNRGHFVRVNVTMSPHMLSHLKTVGAKLQALGEKDTDVSSLVRYACKDFLCKAEEFLPNPDEV